MSRRGRSVWKLSPDVHWSPLPSGDCDQPSMMRPSFSSRRCSCVLGSEVSDHLGGDALLLGVEADDEACNGKDAGVVDLVHAVADRAAGVLLLLHGDERRGVAALDADEDDEEVAVPQHVQELLIVGEIE